MNFKSDLQYLKKQIEFYSQGEEFQQQIDDCQQIQNRLSECHSPLALSVRKQKLVQRLPDHSAPDLQVPTMDSATLDSACQAFADYRALWGSKGPDSLQDDGNQLNNLVNAVKQLHKELEQNHSQAWSAWTDLQQDRFVVLDEVLKNQKLVSNGISVEQDYRHWKKQFEQALGTFNFQELQLTLLTQMADQLHELRGKMNTEDLPESVQKFLGSLHISGKHVTLELLTEEVFFWLKERDLLGKFVVKQS
ncbi:hypothetical protein L1D54_12715 [Vibrio brasiliensis]|uniref:hypothetical protein n=1 Tax=Vibrio brasiliensis TaxID=170652 RepID=UPI001EFE403D|nr:hypothetical protein [Vibrio brasiliensis]MCG9751348.1 hypothetical protein [Vibrio brasiliensis]